MRKFFSLITALVLCTAMWGVTYKTFYKVEGALYQGINVDFTTNKNMFVPNGASVTYSTFDGQPADWYNNGSLKKSGQSSYKVSNLADASYYKYQIKNYTGYDAQDPKIDYMYGTVDNKNYFLRAGSGTMYMMSMANAYCVCTESSTASNVGKYYVDNKSMLTLSADDSKTYGTSMKYGTNFSYAKNGGLIYGYEMLLDNPGEMYIDYIVLPIYGSTKSNETTIEKMIPEGAKLTLTLYSIDLTLGSDGIYTYTRKTPSITTVTATADNFTADGDYKYRGTVKFTPENPLLISGDFVARLTWDDGCEFGLITDDNNLQNFTTFYLWKDDKGSITKSYMWKSSSANASISYHAMFPVLEKKDTKTALEFTHEGGDDEVAIKSNIDPSSKDFSIDFGGADWISLDSLRYTTEGKYVAKETVYVVFKAEANTGEAREATITLKHHGKVLTYTVSQEAAPAKDYYLVGYINGANTGCEEDYETFPEEYKFVDGTLTTTFTEKSYVFVKTSDNNHWFLTESYVESAAKVTATLLEGKSEKVGVNPNVEVTFTLTENADGSVTLSYEEAAAPQPELKYYVTGNAALVGEDNAWKAQAIEMIDSTYTFTELAAGEYEMKITNGAWDPEGQSWGSAALSEECSAGVGDKDGNIHFIVETPNDVTVSIANGSVTVIGTFKQVATGITVNVTVPEGTPACYFYGEMSGNTFVEMTKVDETHYTIDFPKATTIGWGYKFVWENGNWSTCNADPEGDIKVEPVEGVINVEVKAWVTAPGTEYKYTTYTEWQVKFGPAWEWVNMTKQEDGTFTVEAVWGNTGINIASGENPIKQDWYALDDPALTVEEGVVEGDNVVISLTVVNDETVALNVAKGETPQPVETKYYITGNAALCGEKAWDAQAIEMIDSTYTFTELAAGEYEMKITNGAWDPEGQSWGSAALSEKCSAGVGDKDGNIHFIVETPNDVTVSIANGSVTVTGTFKQVATGITVNVTVPEGTPACFFYGEMSGNTFVEMTKVDETHYTIDFPKATTIGWGYKFVWENGNWSTCNADPEGDIKVEPVEGVINVEVKAWATAPGTEYKYTTYTEWQVKFGPAWEWVNMTKQEDGTFTVEAVWGNTGINIASGENPIKKDWYPLGDPALTVEEGVVEGDNVVISLTVVNDETVALNVKKQTATNLNNVKAQDGKRYNILGQPVNETYRGIVIMNGQTYLQ